MKIFATAALLLTGSSLMAQTKHKPKFPNPKLRTSIELGIISAEAKVHYNITRQHNLSLGFGYGNCIVDFPFNGVHFMDNYSSKSMDESIFSSFKVWSSLMTNFSYRYYFRHRGNYLPNGGYVAALARYRGPQINTTAKDRTFMRSTSVFGVQLGTMNYFHSNRLYTDVSIGYGIYLNDTYSHKEFAPLIALKAGLFIWPNKVREDKTTTP
jgi:hypothetical protein